MGGEGRRTGRKKVVHESEETRLTALTNPITEMLMPSDYYVLSFMFFSPLFVFSFFPRFHGT